MGVLMHMKDFKDDKGKRTMRSTSMESKEEGHSKEKRSRKSNADRGQEKFIVLLVLFIIMDLYKNV